MKTAGGKLILPTPQATGGDFATVDDATQQISPLGGVYVTTDSSGRVRIYKYVRYNPTAAGSKAEGTPVYYINPARTEVSDNHAEADSYVVGSMSAYWSWAGLLLNPSVTNGYYTWTQTGGFSSRVGMAGAILGDWLVLTNGVAAVPTNNLFVILAAATDVTLHKAATAYGVAITDPTVGGFCQGWIFTPGGGLV